MKLLLDTHTFIWWDNDKARLSKRVLSLCEDSENNSLFVSHATIWELQIKVQLGRLTLRTKLDKLVEEQRELNDLRLLEITMTDIFHLNQLPHHHGDPFDRMLIAQADRRGLTILSKDRMFSQYAVPVIW